MSNERMNLDQAREEFINWLDYKKVSPSKREPETVEPMIEAIYAGDLDVDPETHKLTYRLKFPIGEGEGITELEFKARLSRKELMPFTRKLKPTDVQGLIVAYVIALTGQPKAVVESLDSTDQVIADTISTFFM